MNRSLSFVKLAAALVCGLLFGLGLSISGMTNPERVIGFLDVTGHWDPTLLFVMGTALLVAVPGYRFALARSKPLVTGKFQLPTKSAIDPQLVGGATLFGVGWGIAGFCPGPAFTALGSGVTEVYLFVIAMGVGMCVQEFLLRLRQQRSSQRR